MADANSPTRKPIGRPRGEQSENAARRRQQLVEAAIESIVELGMSATTLATVAKAAGLSQGVAVFYFKGKENLLVATLRHHYEEYTNLWKSAVAKASDDPIDRVMALILADLDPRICTARNLSLWNSFWGEAAARPRFAELCEAYDKERYDMLVSLCKEASGLAIEGWSPIDVADAFDSMTDGMWIRMHITPDFMDLNAGRKLLARQACTIYPSHAKRIVELADAALD
ncbi:MAG: TetR family transcriptional regulator C-terminal domain-containing protein [Alphaproteobacteria bacterium]|nr:TetR family transcriptional regulator C-terminal domain-containing protein [Alphaproteobacteria bacterium]